MRGVFLSQLLDLVSLDPSHPKFSKRQGECYYSLSRICLQQLDDNKQAVEYAEQAVKYAGNRVDVLALYTKSLFRLQQLEKGRQSLFRTLELSSCTAPLALDLVESCCDMLDIKQVAGQEKNKRIILIQEVRQTGRKKGRAQKTFEKRSKVKGDA